MATPEEEGLAAAVGFKLAVDARLFDIMMQVRVQYPDMFAIIDKPGVWDVLSQAMLNHWPVNRMQAALEGTPYYQNTTVQQREWDALAGTDPATARDRGNQAGRLVEDMTRQLGIDVSDADKLSFTIRATTEGWDANRLRYEMLILRDPSGIKFDELSGGEFAKNAADVKALADSYGIPAGDRQAFDWARNITQGVETLDSIKGSYIGWASTLYPALKDRFALGQTLADYAQPYMQLAQRELGINPAQISLSDPKWTSMFLKTDDSGKQVVRRADEALAVLRSDPQFGYDSSEAGTQAAAGLGTQLRQMFGMQG